MKNILMVCLGNICRSPLAEGILKSKLSSKNFYVDSAGTSGYHEGEMPDKRSIEIGLKYGIDISNQRSRKFTKSDFNEFDLIFAMDKSNYNNIVGIHNDIFDIQKVKIILNEIYPNENRSVPDPYYGVNKDFEEVYKMLDKVCNVIASKLNKNER